MSHRVRRAAALAVVAGALGLAAAGLVAAPAQARPHGPLIPANVYFFDTKVDLDHAKDADVVKSGTGFISDGNWHTIAVDQKCPKGTLSTEPLVRVPGTGKNEDEWEEYQLAPQSFRFDAEGRPVSYEETNGFALPIVADYLNQHGNHADNFRMVVVCLDANLNGLGYFQTAISAENKGMSTGTLESPANTKVYPNVVWKPQNTDLSNVGRKPAGSASGSHLPWTGIGLLAGILAVAAAAVAGSRALARRRSGAPTPDQKEQVSA